MDYSHCCRTCLSVQNLNPIFALPEHSEKFSEVIFNTIGIKVQIHDTLPKHICAACINFINEIYKFRRTCRDSEKALLRHYQESTLIKTENVSPEIITSIDISDLITVNDFSDYDDNIILSEYHVKLEQDRPETQNGVGPETQNGVGPETQNGVEPERVKIKTVKSEKLLKETKVRRKYSRNTEKESVKKRIGPKKEDGDDVKTESDKQEYKCELCPRVFTSKWSILSHKKTHGTKVVCEHCGKKFIAPRRLLMHCKAKHGYEKTDKCSFCDYRGIDRSQVKVHERIHTGEKPYVCASCGAGFHRSSSYHQHIASHLPEKTVQCDQCPARFKSATLMRIHRQRHAKRYTYACRVCDNTFTRRTNVVRHLLRIHALSAHGDHIARNKCE